VGGRGVITYKTLNETQKLIESVPRKACPLDLGITVPPRRGIPNTSKEPVSKAY
jgi:hypothetical protein